MFEITTIDAASFIYKRKKDRLQNFSLKWCRIFCNCFLTLTVEIDIHTIYK